jgi:hypothetical protein
MSALYSPHRYEFALFSFVCIFSRGMPVRQIYLGSFAGLHANNSSNVARVRRQVESYVIAFSSVKRFRQSSASPDVAQNQSLGMRWKSKPTGMSSSQYLVILTAAIWISLIPVKRFAIVHN